MADETKLTAATRLEKLLDNIAGGENEVTPATRLEKFLSYIADAMEGGGSGGVQLYGPYTAKNRNMVSVNAGQLLEYEFPYITDNQGNRVLYPQNGNVITLMNYIGANADSNTPNFTILYVGPDAIGLYNNGDSELDFLPNALAVVFYSTVEFPIGGL